MRTWTRTTYPRRCGHCGTFIPLGDPVCVLRPYNADFEKFRCVDCAGEPVPADLPDAVTLHQRQRVTLRDWKTLAAGDREPGEDG